MVIGRTANGAARRWHDPLHCRRVGALHEDSQAVLGRRVGDPRRPAHRPRRRSCSDPVLASSPDRPEIGHRL